MQRDPISPGTRQYVLASHIAWEYDEEFENLPLFRYDTRVLDEVLTERGRVLDLGCGTGRHLIHLAKRGFNTVGLDLSPFMLDVARQKLRDASLKVQLIRGDLCNLAMFRSDAFRYAICMFSTLGLIRWHENRVAFLKEVRRILEPGGVLVVHAHNRFSNITSMQKRLWLLKSYLLRPFRRTELGDIVGEYRGIPNMFMHTFSPGELRSLLIEADFDVERMIQLNANRSGPLEAKLLTSLRSHGMIAVAKR